MQNKENATEKMRVYKSSKPILRIISAETNKTFAELVELKIIRPFRRRTQQLLRNS